MNTYEVNKSKLGKRPIGCIVGSEADNNRFEYKNIVISYINDIPILIKTNLSSEQWRLFELGQLSQKELGEYI